MMTRTIKSTEFAAVRRVLALIAMGAMLSGSGLAAADPTQSTGANSTDMSGNGSQGIIELNQNAGDSNNQGNAVAIAGTASDTSAALASLVLDSEQHATTSTSAPTVQTNTISGSFNDTSGIAQVNQTTGQGNVQLNAIAIAFAAGADFSPALTDVELHAVAAPVSNGGTSSAAAGSANSLSNSFNGFKGIAQVQQIAGDSNVVVNVVAVAASGGAL
jgi:hypothetical protein